MESQANPIEQSYLTTLVYREKVAVLRQFLNKYREEVTNELGGKKTKIEELSAVE